MTKGRQYWTRKHPCSYCGATSNITHALECINYGLFDEFGCAIPVVPKNTLVTDRVLFDDGKVYYKPCRVPLNGQEGFDSLVCAKPIGHKNPQHEAMSGETWDCEKIHWYHLSMQFRTDVEIARDQVDVIGLVRNISEYLATQNVKANDFLRMELFLMDTIEKTSS